MLTSQNVLGVSVLQKAAGNRLVGRQAGGDSGSYCLPSTGAHTCPGWPWPLISLSPSTLNCSLDPGAAELFRGPLREQGKVAAVWCRELGKRCPPLSSTYPSPVPASQPLWSPTAMKKVRLSLLQRLCCCTGLGCCMQAFLCGEWRLLSSCGARLLVAVAALAVEHWL